MTPFHRISGYSLTIIVLVVSTLIPSSTLLAQRTVSITIDDVPNTRMYSENHFHAPFLDSLDAMHIPITIFINEGAIFTTVHHGKNKELLNQWVKRDYITLGNHTLHHARYSAVGIDSFKVEIDSGEILTRALAKEYHKSLDYFRFPYNDLGKDSIEHHAIADYLQIKNYVLTPFTIESSDYMYNYLYTDYLRSGKKDEAARIAEEYIRYTLQLFEYFDSLSIQIYKRPVHQIYLCHDNPLNRDYLKILLESLQHKGYQCITLKEALADTIYSQQDYYSKKWGISWLYRWMQNPKERLRIIQSEPPMKDINDRYEALMKKNGK